MTRPTATLLISCPDRKGLVALLANFIASHNGNIIHADHHTDFTAGLFLSRLEWQLEDFDLKTEEITPAFSEIAKDLQANWQLHLSSKVRRIALWVSRQDHCLLDLIWRQRSQEICGEIPLIVSNHESLKPIAAQYGIDFEYLPITKDNKVIQEARQLEILKNYHIDLVVLAKYMQVLSQDFLRAFPNVINIHHSFLPAFVGANPYGRAYERGVKIIGATAHYVTPDLDAGPIIEQDVVRVSHRDEVSDLVRKGKDLERVVLARAVRYHLQNRVLVYGNRTVVFA
ncbi:formyltetrahydrofolate deformylase [Tychonema sp. LEGE 07203]|uniref:formyltetrahydrofolate deformylase n=1 Tax=Tychonema sp. LEGE 07203 TaxID=1828671 RepID=UPI00187FAB9F|nr:formyltetrahydrofolate deformylase [Tychonema sp. LEGE 07203]MBE9095587.1 formyltetrahydrofolate deformylase [Tychonema sp. LEGE 07203]